MIGTYSVVIIFILIAYLLGSIPSAVMIGKRYYGVDIREHGSKNAGSTNVLRVLGKRAAIVVFALDFLKGFVAVSVVGLIDYDPYWSINGLMTCKVIAVFAAVIGHIFPIFAGFRGGKGVATLVGAITGIYPTIMLMCFGVWLIMMVMFNYVSLASITGGVCLPVFTLISPSANQSIVFVIFSFAVALLLIWTHRKNIERLKKGEESKTYIFKQRKEPDQE